jgi:predicted amidohydrolase
MNKNWTDSYFDLNATITKGVKLIEEAASNGANLIVFPELWFPGYLPPASDSSKPY